MALTAHRHASAEGDLDVIYVCGPGHGGPGMVANTEGEEHEGPERLCESREVR